MESIVQFEVGDSEANAIGVESIKVRSTKANRRDGVCIERL